MGDYFQFDLVFIYKKSKLIFFLNIYKKIKTGSNRRFRFSSVILN